MNMNELKEMCLKDTKIDGVDLDGYSISIPELSSKYFQLRHEEKNALRFLENQYKSIGMDSISIEEKIFNFFKEEGVNLEKLLASS